MICEVQSELINNLLTFALWKKILFQMKASGMSLNKSIFSDKMI